MERNTIWFGNDELDIEFSENDVLDWIKENDEEYYPTAKSIIEDNYDSDLMVLYNFYFPKTSWYWEENRFQKKYVNE